MNLQNNMKKNETMIKLLLIQLLILFLSTKVYSNIGKHNVYSDVEQLNMLLAKNKKFLDAELYDSVN